MESIEKKHRAAESLCGGVGGSVLASYRSPIGRGETRSGQEWPECALAIGNRSPEEKWQKK